MSAEFLFGLLLCHFIGDYVTQSHWMAVEKTSKWWPAWAHGLSYSLPFAVLLLLAYGFVPGVAVALFFILTTHVIIDRYRLAKYVGWLKNQVGPKRSRPSFQEAMANAGYSESTPSWMAVWLMIIADNTIHVIINFVAVWVFLH